MRIVNEMELKEIIESGNPVFVDFYAEWCGPCRFLMPILGEIESENRNIDFVKVNIDNDIEFASFIGVHALPTICIFNNGEEVERFEGVVGKSEILRRMRDCLKI